MKKSVPGGPKKVKTGPGSGGDRKSAKFRGDKDSKLGRQFTLSTTGNLGLKQPTLPENAADTAAPGLVADLSAPDPVLTASIPSPPFSAGNVPGPVRTDVPVGIDIPASPFPADHRHRAGCAHGQLGTDPAVVPPLENAGSGLGRAGPAVESGTSAANGAASSARRAAAQFPILRQLTLVTALGAKPLATNHAWTSRKMELCAWRNAKENTSSVRALANTPPISSLVIGPWCYQHRVCFRDTSNTIRIISWRHSEGYGKACKGPETLQRVPEFAR